MSTTYSKVNRYPVDEDHEKRLHQLLNDLDSVSKNALGTPKMLNNAPKRTPVIRIVPNIQEAAHHH